MGKPQRRFRKEFAAEAVRLVECEWSDAKGDRQGPRRRPFDFLLRRWLETSAVSDEDRGAAQNGRRTWRLS